MKERFLKQGYDKKFVDKELGKIKNLVSDDLVREKNQEQQNPKCIPLILTYKQFLPNLSAVVCKNWNILQTNKNLQRLFQEHPITSFNTKKSLKKIIEDTSNESGKVKNFNIPSSTEK